MNKRVGWGGCGRRAVVGVALVLASAGARMNAEAQDPPAVLDRVAGVELVDVSLREALNQIQRSTGAALVFSPDLVPVNRIVSCPCTDRTLRAALEHLLTGTNLTFSSLGNQVRILPRARTDTERTLGVVAGSVLDISNEKPVPNALIQLSDGRGSLSNENGRFILVNVPPGTYTLTVTGLGWEPSTLTDIRVVAGGTATVEVRLTRRVIPLSALVVSPGTFVLLDEAQSVTVQTLSREEIETVPQVGEDVFRSLKRLPGVASGDISTKLFLRGGQDRETLILLDGMELYEPYHLKDFEGALGIVDINTIGGIDLHAGGFPVEFGDRAAGVFDMETRNPPTEGTRTTLGLSITNATVMSQGAFAGGRGQWLFSGRRGYMDIALSLTDANSGISPVYYDLLGKVKYQLGSRHSLSAHVLHGGDDLELDPDALLDDNEEGELSTGYGNSYGWLTWKAFFSPGVRAQTVASLGRVSRSRVGYIFDPGRIEGPEFLNVSDKAHFEFFGIKQDWTVDLSDQVAFRAGALFNRLVGNYDYSNRSRTLYADDSGDLIGIPDSVDVDLDPTGNEYEAYAALRLRPVPWLTTEAGLRYDERSHTGDSDISPRLHAMLDLGENTTLRAGWGIYQQSQGMNELEAADGETEFVGSERARQIAVGIEHRLDSGIQARLEAYDRAIEKPRRMYLNLWREILPFPELDGDRVRVDPTEARARGMEVLFRKDGRRLDWSASYSLATTEARIDGDWVPQYWDQRHAVSLTVGWRPSPKWTVTAAWQAHSGWPFTPQIIEFDTLTVFQDEGLDSALRWREEFGNLNSERLPTYHRLDLRVTRRWALPGSNLEVYLDLFNAYNQENLRSYDYATRFIGNEMKWVRYSDEELLPILPSIGFRWEF